MGKMRTNQFMESLLNRWYGVERGRLEMTRFTPQAETLHSVLDRIETRLIPPWQRKIQQLQEEWSGIVGAENARRCRVVSCNEGILYIEVIHPMYRMILETASIKNGILEKVQERTGTDFVREIRFVAGGRAPIKR